jgi:hypothetical protein
MLWGRPDGVEYKIIAPQIWRSPDECSDIRVLVPHVAVAHAGYAG